MSRKRKNNNCLICSGELPKGKAKYCNPDCAMTAKKEKAQRSIFVICQLCPRGFYNDKSGRQKYCTACKPEAYKRAQKKKPSYLKVHPVIERPCLWCRHRFIAPRKDQLFCKQQCARHMSRNRKNKSKPRKNNVDKKCMYCGDNVQLLRHVACKPCSLGKRLKTGNLRWKELQD